ncbi:maleylacetoacetate isomerase [Pseudonocardia sp. TMWB2A]|uniref:maleylacetoacetate isomerase n=1 Tax=Pseudonocardia sp. TMWB2A TaxID=687430 RepID=UPI00307F2F99
MTAPSLTLYDYFRSSASYRVRIALNLKGVAYEAVPTNLVEGAQRAAEHLARNPQGFVPTLEHDGQFLGQSLVIIDWLDARYPQARLIPAEADARAKVLAAAMVIIADIHPLNNLRVLKYLKAEFGATQEQVDDWYRHWIAEGFTALEALAPTQGLFGGDAPDLVDVCLVPQIYNARRFDTSLDAFPKLVRIDAALTAMDAFAKAAPEAVQPA